MGYKWRLRAVVGMMLSCALLQLSSCTGPGTDAPSQTQALVPDSPAALLAKTLQAGDLRVLDLCLPGSDVDVLNTAAETREDVHAAVYRAIAYARTAGFDLSRARFEAVTLSVGLDGRASCELRGTAGGHQLWIPFEQMGPAEADSFGRGTPQTRLDRAVLLWLGCPTTFSPEERRALLHWNPGEDTKADDRWAKLLVERHCPDDTLSAARFTEFVSSDAYTRPCSRETIQEGLVLMFASQPSPDEVDTVRLGNVGYGGEHHFSQAAGVSELIETGRDTLVFQEPDYEELERMSRESSSITFHHRLCVPMTAGASLSSVSSLTITVNAKPYTLVRTTGPGITFELPTVEILEAREQRIVQFRLVDGVVTEVTFPATPRPRVVRRGLLFE